MERDRNDLTRRILSNKNQLIEIIFVGIVLGVGVNILAGGILTFLELKNIHFIITIIFGAFVIFLPVIYFAIKVFRERLKNDASTFNSLIISEKNELLNIVEIPKFYLAEQVQKLVSQGINIHNNWLSETEDVKKHILTEALVFFLFREMERSLYAFFGSDKTASTKIVGNLRDNNRFFNIFYKENAPGETPENSLRLNLLEDSEIQDFNIREGIKINTKTVFILLRVGNLSNSELPTGFKQIYLKRDNKSSLEVFGITLSIFIQFKPKAITSKVAWRYYRWFDSFQAELYERCSTEAFFRKIGWDSSIVAINGTIELLRDEFLIVRQDLLDRKKQIVEQVVELSQQRVQQELSLLKEQIIEGVAELSQLEKQRLYKLRDDRRLYLARDKLIEWLCKFHEYHQKTKSLYSFEFDKEDFIVPFLTKQEWEARGQPITISINQDTILRRSTKSNEDFNIDIDLILDRKAIGQKLWDAPTLYLDDISSSNEPDIPPVLLIVKNCRYFESATAALELENETVEAVKTYFSDPQNEEIAKKSFENCPIRIKYYLDAKQRREDLYRPMTLGCMVVFALKADDGYEILIQTRSSKNATANGVTSIAPTFGLSPFLGQRPESKKGIIFHNFLKEYLEELHNHNELIEEFDTDKSYDDYLESIYSNKLIKLLPKDSFELTYLGFGYNLINGFPNVGLLAQLNDCKSSKLLKEKMKTNWEIASGQPISYIKSTDPVQLKATIETLDPGGAYFLHCALKYLNDGAGLS